MCKKLYICKDDSKWDTCGVEKMGCQGCYYFQQLYELVDGPEINKEFWKKKGGIKNDRRNF